MSKQDYTAEAGPSWWDVYKLIDELEKEFVGKVKISINRAKRNKDGVGTYVRTSFQTYESAANGVDTCAKGNWWTKDDYKTITALLHYQVSSCYNWCEARRNEAETQQRF